MADISPLTTGVFTAVLDDQRRALSRDNNLHSSLLRLPRELVVKILLFVQPGDLLNLRQTNRHLHNLVHNHERSLVRAHGEELWAKYNLSRIRVRPDGRRSDVHQSFPSTFTELFIIYREYDSISLLSNIIAYHILQHCEPITWRDFTPQQREDHHNCESLHAWRQIKARRISQELFRSYLVLQTFLRRLARIAVDCEVYFADLDEQQYSRMRDVFDLDQQDIIRDMELDHFSIMGVTRAFDIFYNVCAARGCHLSECLSDRLAISVKMVVMFHGLVPFRKFLNPECQTEKHTLWNIESERLMKGPLADQPKNHRLEELVPTIFAIGPTESPHERKLFSRRWHSVYSEFYDRQDLWNKAAIAQLGRSVAQSPDSPPIVSSTAYRWIESVIADNRDANAGSGVVVGPWWEYKAPSVQHGYGPVYLEEESNE